MKYDAIVLGLGAMGSATVYQLAKRGARVLGIDRFSPPHEMGSTHGGTRVTRLAIGEGAHYTPLVMRSHEIWREIERETGADLLNCCGGLFISSENKQSIVHVEGFFRNTVAAARTFGIVHELLDAREIRRRHPQFAVGDSEFGYFEPSAGFVRPEACVTAQLDLAEKRGATLRRNERVHSFDPSPHGVSVVTDMTVYSADTLIVAAGAWLPEFLGLPLFKVYRQVQYWFEIGGDPAPYRPDRFPIFVWELERSRQGIYGFPTLDGQSVKLATEIYESQTTPAATSRHVTPQDVADMYAELVEPNLSGIGSRCVKASTCLYTLTPDSGFVIDRMPGARRVIVASPCSGHGFKHSPAIGEALADLVLEGRSRHDLTPFRLSRFG